MLHVSIKTHALNVYYNETARLAITVLSVLPRIENGSALLEEKNLQKGNVCSGNFILRALHTRNYFLRAHCTNCGQHNLCLKCNIRGHSSVT